MAATPTTPRCNECGNLVKPGATCRHCGGLTREQRFWSYVEKTPTCWLWHGSRGSGYGQFRWNGAARGAHRLAWELTNGPIPDGLFICHNCPGGDNRFCVNPAHMFLGTNLDNVRDAVAKGRVRKGERHGHAKLTEAQVLEYRRRYAAGGVTFQALANEAHVDITTVHAAVRGESWKHCSV